MFKNKRSMFYILGVLLLICVTVGYAYLNSTLVINGSSNILKNTWDIHFENIKLDDGSATTNIPEMTSDTININTTLSKPGDYYRFDVDIVNAGTINAVIERIEIESDLTEENFKYFYFDSYYEDGTAVSESQYLLCESFKTITVTIEYIKDLLGDDLPKEDVNIDVTVKIIYSQTDYYPDANLIIMGRTWSQKPGISMYDAINNKYAEMDTDEQPRADEYTIYDMDGADVFIDDNGRVMNLKKMIVRSGKTYETVSYCLGSSVVEDFSQAEFIENGNYITTFIDYSEYIDGENYSDNRWVVFMSESDTYVNVVHSTYLVGFILPDPRTIEALKQEVLDDYILAFTADQDEGCNSTAHRFFVTANEEGELLKITDKVNHMDKRIIISYSISENEMTYEEAKEYMIGMLNDYLNNED